MMSKIKYPDLPRDIRRLLKLGWNQSQTARKLSEKYKTTVSRSIVNYHTQKGKLSRLTINNAKSKKDHYRTVRSNKN